VLRRVFVPKRDEVTGGWRKLHNEKVRNCTAHKYNCNGKVKEDEMGRTCRRGMHIRHWWESQKEEAPTKTKT
jgi:hypothetical protein